MKDNQAKGYKLINIWILGVFQNYFYSYTQSWNNNAT